MHGCQVLYHAAGRMGASPAIEPFWPVNVTGTRNMLAAAADALVRRFIYLGAAMSLLGSPRPITGADESWPTATTTLLRIRGVQDTRRPSRPSRQRPPDGHRGDPARLGLGHPRRSVNRQLRAGSAGRRHAPDRRRPDRIVATHIDNLIHAVDLAIDHGAGGRGYYVFDDGSTTVRDFLAGLLQAHGLTLPEASIPGPAAAGVAQALDIGWRITRRPGDPPITR